MYGAPHYKTYQSGMEQLVDKLALMMSDSSKNFNNALRSYYFGLSLLSWLISPVLFIVTNILVVAVLYRREFHSKTLNSLKEINRIYDASFEQEKQASAHKSVE